MIEIEIKVLDINKKEMIKKLEDLGAKKILDEDIQAYYFDNKNKLNKNRQILRLRKIGNKNYLTYKSEIKSELISKRKELEVEVSDLNTMFEILKKLNYKVIKKVIKHRTSYKINDTTFDIDEFNEIPCLMEIESKNEKEIFKYIELLNINKNKLSTLGYFGLLKYYKRLK